LFEVIVLTHEKPDFKHISHKLSKYSKKIIAAGISSVVPAKDKQWADFIQNKFEIKPLFVSEKLKLPVKLKVQNAKTLGADRICNAAAAYAISRGRKNVIVIDLGTATTYDVVLKNGDYVGGIISAGIVTSSKALHDYTGKLPALSSRQFVFPRKAVGRNTLEAIQSGVMFNASMMVDSMVRAIKKEYPGEFEVVITGGLAPKIHRKIETKARIEKNLVLKGLNSILQFIDK
jgi:type III pantothenate kinase